MVTAWFAGKVPFNFHLPSSHEQPEAKQVYRLIGGRLVNYKGGYVALVAYQMQQKKISLLVTSSSSAPSAGGEEIRSGGILFHYSREENLNVITWSNHGLRYALVSSLPGSRRQSCLVCHQNYGGSHPLWRSLGATGKCANADISNPQLMKWKESHGGPTSMTKAHLGV